MKNSTKTGWNLLIILPFLLITAYFSVMHWAYPAQQRSEAENRLLAQKPVLAYTYKSVTSFSKDFDRYYSDQFPYRERFLELFSRIQLASWKNTVRDLYIANGFLLPKEYLYAKNDIAASAKKTNELMAYIKAAGKKAGYVSLPYKSSVYSYMLPGYIHNDFGEENYQNFISRLDPGIGTCDAFRCYDTESRSNMEQYFFKTDLHWNAKGAGVAFQYMLNWLYEKAYIRKPVHIDAQYDYIEGKEYLGDLNRRLSFLLPTHEPIPVLRGKSASVKYYLEYGSSDFTLDRSVITYQEAAEGTANYGSVYSENLGYYKMVNEDSLLDTRILLIKDSMQDAMTDLFAETFRETEVIDIRALKDISLYQAIADSRAELVLLMYHQNNITGSMFDFTK